MSAISKNLSFWDMALFDPISATMAIGGAALSILGGGVAASGALASGKNAEAMGRFQQEEAVEQGNEDLAFSQRRMLEQQRQGKLIQSKLQANAAASGVTASGDSPVKLASDLAGRTEYESLMTLSSGEGARAGMINQGDAARYQGDLSKAMSRTAAEGDIMSGVGSAFSSLSKINMGGLKLPGGGGGDSGAVSLYAQDRPTDWG